MLCDKCESELRKSWKFCPVCGSEIIRDDIFVSLGNILKNITREMEPFQEDVELQHYDTEQQSVKPAHALRKTNGEVKDPKMTVRNLGNRIIFKIRMTGAKPEHVSITELNESFEVRSNTKGAAYFKIIAVPQGFELAGQYFEGDKLVLEFAA